MARRGSMRRTTAGALLLAAVASALAGCSHRGEPCARLIGAVNEGTHRLSTFEAGRQKRASAGAAQTAQDMRRLAAIYDENTRALEGVPFGEADLRNFATEYAQTSKTAADAARSLASALDSQEHGRAAEAEGSLERAVRDQKATIAALNAACPR